MNNSSLLVMIDCTGTYTGSQTTLKTSQRGGGGGLNPLNPSPGSASVLNKLVVVVIDNLHSYNLQSCPHRWLFIKCSSNMALIIADKTKAP